MRTQTICSHLTNLLRNYSLSVGCLFWVLGWGLIGDFFKFKNLSGLVATILKENKKKIGMKTSPISRNLPSKNQISWENFPNIWLSITLLGKIFPLWGLHFQIGFRRRSIKLLHWGLDWYIMKFPKWVTRFDLIWKN